MVSLVYAASLKANAVTAKTDAGTSLAFNAGIVEMFAQAQILGGSDYRYFERYISVALVYWVISIIIEQIGRLIEKRMDIDTPQSSQKEVTGDIR